MSNEQLVGAVLARAPEADPGTVLELIASLNGDLDKVFSLLGIKNSGHKRQTTFKVSKSATTHAKASITGPQKGKATVVDLFTPDQVASECIPCSLHLNVLDHALANRLLGDLLEQSKEWPKSSFYLFDREVSSPHTSGCYSSNESLLKSQNVTYQGRQVSGIRAFSREMTEARDIVEKLVNEHAIDVSKGQKPWISDVALCNLYKNRTENVGWHSDQLTHIGPRPIIAGLSLGCTREFRLRSRHEKSKVIYSIHLPHNSLIIMHGGCQEEFKHCIAPAKAIDSHAISGAARISITYRMYPEEYTTKKIPKCRCDLPMILRTTIGDNYSYIWQCGANYSNNKGCSKVLQVKY